MNIDQSKQIPLHILVERLGGTFARKGTRHELWYHSPFRPEERTPSFKIDEAKNTWHDFARTQGVDAHGDILDLWTDYHNLPRRTSDSVKAALAALRQDFGGMASYGPPKLTKRPKTPRIVEYSTRFKITKLGSIWANSLKAEIARRNLSMNVIWPYLKQAVIVDTQTKRRNTGFAFLNDLSGHEISIPNPYTLQSFKLCVGPKALTTIAGHGANARDVCVFEGFWDGLTWLAMNGGPDKPRPRLCILNSTSLVHVLTSKLIKNKAEIGNVFLYLDNDAAGEKAANLLLEQLEPHGFAVGTKNHVYKGFKDLSAGWVGKIDCNL